MISISGSLKNNMLLVLRIEKSFNPMVSLDTAKRGKLMGSTGSGSFSDYSGSSGSGSQGGASGTDRCTRALSCTLEEVAQCEYFSSSASLPPLKAKLRIKLNNRLFAIDENGKVVGALPTKFNYLAECIADGFNYSGVVTQTATSPIPTVSADFGPE